MKTLRDEILNSLQTTTLLKPPVSTELGPAYPDGSLKVLVTGGNVTVHLAQGGTWKQVGGADGDLILENVLAAGNDANNLKVDNLGRATFATDEVKIGDGSGAVNQGTGAIAVGNQAGNQNQGTGAVAVGAYSGQTDQGNYAVAVGSRSGNLRQGVGAVALGNQAGETDQGDYAVAIGRTAGETKQGNYAVAIGDQAGTLNQPEKTIIINASGSPLNITVPEPEDPTNRCYINPIRPDSPSGGGNDMRLYYDPTTSEVVRLTPP